MGLNIVEKQHKGGRKQQDNMFCCDCVYFVKKTVIIKSIFFTPLCGIVHANNSIGTKYDKLNYHG